MSKPARLRKLIAKGAIMLPGIPNAAMARQVERNAELSAMYPDAVGNIVHVDLADGRRLTRRVDYPLGNAKNRLKDSAVEGKFLGLVERIIGESRAKKITELVWKLDEAKNVDALMQALQMPEEK